MRYIAPAPDSDWELFELERREKRPCSDAYADDANDTELSHVLSQLRLLRAAGCPPDEERGRPNVQKVGKHTPRGSDHQVTVYVLKAKPSRWRLYFFVDDPQRRVIIFLYAVSKKTNARDPNDFKRCCTILDAYTAGEYALVEIEVPPC